ncbi:MAG: glycosyltransferase family 4 protein, partial [Rhizobacter sp.]|nr:glycosyltransferase family 4 protein [Rhizobacter sp.]
MRRGCHFVIPGDWHTPTGGYRYDRRIALALRESEWQVDLCTLGDSFPWPDAATLAQAQSQIDALPDGALVVADGLAFGAMPELAQRHAKRLRWVALVHHPLHIETGLADPAREALRASECEALQAASRVIVTSEATARDLAPMGVPSERIRVVEPGTDRVQANRASTNGTVRLLCVATLTSRKGHAVLLQALAGLPALDWALHCVGSAQRDPSTSDHLRRVTFELGLGDRVHWHGELDEASLSAHYAAADLFVLPSFHEGYGMVVTESLAHGLPVVCTTGGALAQTLPRTAGLHVPPGDVSALREALAVLIGQPVERARFAAVARAAAEQLPTWPQAATRFAAVL